MPINSKRKGKANELAFAHWLKSELGIQARRGQQYSGTSDSPDVVADGSQFHFEVKAVEKLNVYSAMQQALKDSASKAYPIVAHKRNRSEWHLTILAKDFLHIARELIRLTSKDV